ncbi:F-actin-capping protein subunit alpha [Phytophthora boehmeriae]|uniref:F-actin-capping protein subunit alpha n=1 Tax=Phytophthora boehmeriae TaxID=109152 RepID=A0A8T1W5P8_9STRA|nr:F-actin-capping protein subunit alpha [Phytophthora boehmeriae]
MPKAVEVVTPPTPVVVEEQPPTAEEPPRPKTLISLDQLEQFEATESAEGRVKLLQTALGVQHYPVNPRTSVLVDFCFGVLNFARDDAHLPPDKTLGLLTLAHELYIYSTQPLQVPAADAEASLSEPVALPLDERIDPEDTGQTEETVVVKVLLSDAPADAYPTVEQAYEQFKDKIRRASGVVNFTAQSEEQSAAGEIPPASAATPLTPAEVAQIVAFFTSTFFRHLRAYQFLSRVARPSVVSEKALVVETPLYPAALADATMSP